MAKQPFENVVQYLFQIAAHAEFKTLNDQGLLQRYVECRDELAFGELVRRYKMMIWYTCWRVLRNHQDVEDAFQATIMTLVRRAKGILGRDSIEGWLHRVAYHVATKAKVMQARRHAREERSTSMRQTSYESQNWRWELEELVDKELDRIPEKYRGPLILSYWEGLTQKEAAQRLGITIDTLDWRLRQGREQLKKRLGKYGMELGPTMLMAQPALGVHVPHVPTGLVERTLDMVRIMTLSNGALETAGVSPQVALLVKGAMGMTLKMKVMLVSLLLSLVVVGAGAAKYAGVLHILRGEQQQKGKDEVANKGPAEPKADKMLPRRDLYGDPLPAGALARLGTVRFRNRENDSRSCIVFTPDSKAVGVLSIDEVPRLWDMKTGAPVHQFGDSLRGQNRAGSLISMNGRRMAYETLNIGYHVQEVVTGKLIRTFEATGQDVYCCALSPDGKTLVGYFGGDLCLMDIATGRHIWKQKIWEQKMKLEGIRGLRSLVFSPDGKNVAVGYEFGDQEKANKGGIELRDVRTGKSLRVLGHPWKLQNGDFSFSPDGQTLMVIYAITAERQVPSVYLWDVVTGKERWHLDQEKHDYTHPAFSPDGKMVALHESDYSICNREIGLYEVVTGKKLGSCQQHKFAFPGGLRDQLTFSPDGKVLASMEGSLLRCWDVATGKVLVSSPFGHESFVWSVAFAPDGRTLISKGENLAVHVWDSFTGRKQRTLSEESSLWPAKTFYGWYWSRARTVASADGKFVVAARCEIPLLDEKRFSLPDEMEEALIARMCASIYIWDTATGREIRQIKVENSKQLLILHKLTLSPDGKLLAAELSSEAFHFVSLWEVATGKQIVKRIEGAHPIFSPDSAFLMTHKDETFNVWEAATGKKVSAVDAGMRFEKWPKLMITPDWQTLVGVVAVDKQRYRWYLNSLQLNEQSKKVKLGWPRYFDMTTQHAPNRLAISPDGRMMAWEDRNSIIHLLETATGEERAQFEGHSGEIYSLSFSPDGCRLASGSADTTILVWDVTGGWLDDRGQLRSTQLSGQQLEQFWVDLAGLNAERASRALWTLVAAPKQIVPFLTKHLFPITNDQASPQRIAQFIKELDHEKYPVRHKAELELSKLGEAAEDGMRKALEERPSAEVRHRLKQLLGAIERAQDRLPSGNVLRGIRAIEILERIGTPDARRLLQTLSRGVSSVRQTREAQAALHRLQ